jgi:hypothetical protein
MDKAEMKPLSERQARRCEEAREPVCHCRCGGAKHGARRAGTEGTPRSFFEQLPEDDPHYVPSTRDNRRSIRDHGHVRQREAGLVRMDQGSGHQPRSLHHGPDLGSQDRAGCCRGKG